MRLAQVLNISTYTIIQKLFQTDYSIILMDEKYISYILSKRAPPKQEIMVLYTEKMLHTDEILAFSHT